MENRNKALVAAVLSNVIFGFGFLFSKIALNAVNNNLFHMIAFRFGLAALAAELLRRLGIFKVNYKQKNIKPLFFVATIYPIGYFIFETIGLKYTSSSQTGIMISLIPIAVTIIAAIMLREIPTIMQSICIAVSVAGTVMINLPGIKFSANYLGLIVLAFAVFCSALYNVLIRKYSKVFTSFEITYVLLWLTAVFFNLVAILEFALKNDLAGFLVPVKNIGFITSIFYLGIFASIGAFFLMNYSLSYLQASKIASFANVSTVISVFAGMTILGESFVWYQIIGVSLIFFGVWGINRYGRKESK